MTDEKLILVWPDGTWCPYEDEEQMSHMSDDFAKLWVPEEYDDDEIERSVARYNNLFGGE